MAPVFSAHNIRLDSGVQTLPEAPELEHLAWFVAAEKVLATVFPGDKSAYRLADLGCLEGGYAVGFARMGFQVLGLDVRESNIAACRHVKAGVNLPQLEFVRDDAWNIANHGSFDAVFCCGLLYHLDQPKRFIELLSRVTRRLLIVQTHFSTEQPNAKFALSEIAENEDMLGRWYTEYSDEAGFSRRDTLVLSSWDNRKSFWLKKQFLIQAIQDAGFDMVMEQYDGLGPDIEGSMSFGYYKTDERGTFIGIKTT